MFIDPCHRCAHVTEEVSQVREESVTSLHVTPVLSHVSPVLSHVTPVLSHVHTCDLNQWTCDDCINNMQGLERGLRRWPAIFSQPSLALSFLVPGSSLARANSQYNQFGISYFMYCKICQILQLTMLAKGKGGQYPKLIFKLHHR